MLFGKQHSENRVFIKPSSQKFLGWNLMLVYKAVLMIDIVFHWFEWKMILKPLGCFEIPCQRVYILSFCLYSNFETWKRIEDIIVSKPGSHPPF